MGWGTSWGAGSKLNETIQKLGEELIEKHLPDKKAEQNFRINLVPTHDPYTNPGAYLYYECECGQRLDPNVKSFASLNNYASEAGWKIRWGAEHYVPYCPKCAEEKGIE